MARTVQRGVPEPTGRPIGTVEAFCDNWGMAQPDGTNKSEAVDRDNEDRLVRQHLALAHYAVADLMGRVPRHIHRDDLLSAAMAALAQAARSFDATRGIGFERYASTRIKGGLLDELRSRDWASRSVRAKARHIAAATDELVSRLGRTPTRAEIARHLDVPVSDIKHVADDVHRAQVLNYDSLVESGDGDEILPPDTQSPDLVLLDRERKAYLVDAVAALPARLRHVVIGYFFEERPMQELADELGVSESRISQMRAEALALLRDGLNANLDPEAVPVPVRRGRVARRKEAYYAAVAAQSDFRGRLDEGASSLARLGRSSLAG